MKSRFTKYLSLAVLVIFMANMGIWSLHSNWLTHEMEHSGMLERMAASSDHADSHKMDAPDDKGKKSPAAMEHRLLHAVDHLQLFPGAIPRGISSSPPGTVRYHFTPQNVALATFEAPFRPPSLSLS